MPYAVRVVIFAAGLACWGSVSYHLGLLASTLGRVADAIRHYGDAATVHERMGARPFLAWTQLAHARLLLTRDAGARRGEAGALLTSALATAPRRGRAARPAQHPRGGARCAGSQGVPRGFRRRRPRPAGTGGLPGTVGGAAPRARGRRALQRRGTRGAGARRVRLHRRGAGVRLW